MRRYLVCNRRDVANRTVFKLQFSVCLHPMIRNSGRKRMNLPAVHPRSLMLPVLLASISYGVAGAQEQSKQQSSRFIVGQVIVVGNKETPDFFIRRLVNLYPEQSVPYADLRRAQNALRRVPFFIAEKSGVYLLEDTGGEYRDILILVDERSYSFALYERSQAAADASSAIIDPATIGVWLVRQIAEGSVPLCNVVVEWLYSGAIEE
jgi:hypothetical protein